MLGVCGQVYTSPEISCTRPEVMNLLLDDIDQSDKLKRLYCVAQVFESRTC